MTDDKRWVVINEDCREAMSKMEAESVDSIVTDPPYGLGFMSKGWDHGVPGVEFWVEALRVAKPGTHLLAFGGTRTFHRLMVAIEDAGWEIRDTIMWVHSSGFPKSMDIGRAIDKRGGVVPNFEEFQQAVREAMAKNGVTRKMVMNALGNHMMNHYFSLSSQPSIPTVRDYKIIRDTVGLGNDWDHVFLPEAERPIIDFKNAVDTKKQRIAAGLGAQGLEKTISKTIEITGPATQSAKEWDGWGTGIKPAYEPIIVARKPTELTLAENVLRYGTGALNVDGCRIGLTTSDAKLVKGKKANKKGRWPANLVHDSSEEVISLFPGNGEKSISRFFYSPKANQADRDEGLDDFPTLSGGEMTDRKDGSAGTSSPRAGAGRTGNRKNSHPTVKPTDLMRYMCRLVTPPNGIVLDPFMGSGSTGKAAVLEGFRFVGVDLEKEYCDIASARIEHAAKQKK